MRYVPLLRRALPLTLALTVALALIACGGDDKSAGSAPQAGGAPATTKAVGQDNSLKGSAESFAKAMENRDFAQLIPALTSKGMSKAMEISAFLPLDPNNRIDFEVQLAGQEGEDHLVNFVVKAQDGSMLLVTRWRNASGAWKIDDMVLKQ